MVILGSVGWEAGLKSFCNIFFDKSCLKAKLHVVIACSEPHLSEVGNWKRAVLLSSHFLLLVVYYSILPSPFLLLPCRLWCPIRLDGVDGYNFSARDGPDGYHAEIDSRLHVEFCTSSFCNVVQPQSYRCCLQCSLTPAPTKLYWGQNKSSRFFFIWDPIFCHRGICSPRRWLRVGVGPIQVTHFISDLRPF